MNQPNASILIVDDNVSLDKTMSFVLRRKGYDVTFATNGLEAIEKVRQSTFDMIFMDVQMPLLNGVETFKRIKTIQPDATVVMMTAYSVEDLVREALQAGAYAVIYKPADVDKVVALIEKARTAQQGFLILVVDDDPGTCSTLETILAMKGYKVGVAHTGEEAIAMEQTCAHDVVLIDMKLPTINGLETYLALKNINPGTVAIVMTAYRDEMGALVEKALANSAYACIYKPLDMGRLLGLIDEIKERRREASN